MRHFADLDINVIDPWRTSEPVARPLQMLAALALTQIHFFFARIPSISSMMRFIRVAVAS